MPSRRAYLAGAGALAGGLAIAAIPAGAGAEPPRPVGAPSQPDPGAQPPQSVEVYARRTQITLPSLPTLGITYIATFDLTDPAGAEAGTAVAGTSIVDVTTDGPVMLSQVVLRLAGGELHYQRVMNRFGDYPRTATGAVLGGTGDYATAQGDVQITWPDADTIHIVVSLRSAQ